MVAKELGSALELQWRSAFQEVECSRKASESSLQIARDEIVMLGNELERTKLENVNLQSALARLDSFIYGGVSKKRGVTSSVTKENRWSRYGRGGGQKDHRESITSPPRIMEGVCQSNNVSSSSMNTSTSYMRNL